MAGKNLIEEYLQSIGVDYKICDVYERVLNKENLEIVKKKSKNGSIIIGFSKSSVEPLISDNSLDLKKLHFFVLNKSEENIIDSTEVNSLTKIDDIYDVEDLAEKIGKING